jgi:hypothetical protein
LSFFAAERIDDRNDPSIDFDTRNPAAAMLASH